MITSTLELATSSTLSGLRSMTVNVGRIALVTLVAIGLAFVTFSAAEVANAQSRVRTYSQSDVERLIRDVEQASIEFQRDFDTWLDRSPFDGRQREDRYNRQVQNLTSALSTLRSNLNGRNDWWLARTDMQRVLTAATRVNTALNNRDAGRGLARQWSRLRRNINLLAQAFNLPDVGSAYTGNQASYPEGRNVRNCATGIYRGWTNTGEAELSIMVNGNATVRSLSTNAIYSGRCANDTLYFDWGAFRLVRDGRGVSTVEIGNPANRTSYRRVSGNPGDDVQTYPNPGYPNPNYPNPNYPGQIGNVPNWAIGTFRGMTDSGQSELTIEANGAATAHSLTTGAILGGRYANDILTFDWGSFRVERDGRGIRTVDVNNPQNRTSYRRVN